MGQVSVTLNGRTYRLSCGDGEEQRLVELSAHVRSHVERLRQDLGQIGDERLLLMASLLITDELYEAREQAGGNPTADIQDTVEADAGTEPSATALASPVAPAGRAASAKALETMDATALMRGLERKVGRG